MNEREAIIWCPVCKADKYEVFRAKAGNEGVYHHVTEPPNLTAYDAKWCTCGATLERK